MSLKFSIMIASVVLAAILAGVWLADVYREHDARAMLLPGQVITLFTDPKPLTAFALTDHKNRVFDLASLKGKWSFLFFGFTHCPDVCPTTLAVLARAHDSIAKNTVGAEDIQFVFISVDPNRDTASKLEQYVDYFDTTFLGVTGNDAQIGNLQLRWLRVRVHFLLVCFESFVSPEGGPRNARETFQEPAPVRGKARG